MDAPNPASAVKEARRKETYTLLTFLIATFLVGIVGALQAPVMSTFLKDEIHASKFWTGVFFTLNAFFAILIGQFIGKLSDRSKDRKKLILIGCLFGVLQCFLFAFSREYWTLLILGIIFSSVGGSVHSQLFAMAREYTVRRGKGSDLFTSTMRAQISLAWVIGPPLAFFLIIQLNFMWMYLISGIAFLFSMALIYQYFPKSEMLPSNKPSSTKDLGSFSKTIIYLTTASTLLSAANGMYMITIPLYLVDSLSFSTSLPGFMMGLVAGIEVPIIIGVSYLSKYIEKKWILSFSAVCGLIFYILVLFCGEKWQFLSIQIFNALFIGIFGSIGIIYFQELMPAQAGHATALFMNSGRLGAMLSGVMFSIVTNLVGYHGIFYVSALFALIALVLFIIVKPELQQESNDTVVG